MSNGKATVISIQSGKPTVLWGKPGTGKSSFVRSLGVALNLPVETIIASIREPSDFAGLPIITKNDDVRLAPPAWARRLADSGRGILFLDELSTAPPAVQSALLRVVLERVVGDIVIPDDVWIVAAANPTDTSSGTWSLSAALANRFVHVNWDLSTKAWVEGMLNGWSTSNDVSLLPENWKETISHTTSMVASFIQARPALLLREPDNAEESGGAWPSPRTWDMATHLIAAARSAGAAPDIILELMVGCVGKGAAVEYMTWEKELDLPDPEGLLARPDSLKLPKRQDQIFAIASSVVAAAKSDLTNKRWLAAWKILATVAEKGHADIAAIPAKTLAKSRTEKLTLPQDVKEFLPVLTAAGLIK
jgi:hypothetical protein